MKEKINNIVIENVPVEIGTSGHVENTYIVYDTQNNFGVIIDPGDKAEQIVSEVNKDNIEIKYIILTHTHLDHFGALEQLQKVYDVDILVNRNDVDGFNDDNKNCIEYIDVKKQNIDITKVKAVEDGQKLSLGNIEFEFIHTPGHTSGSMCIYEKTSNVLFTGDTIFAKYYGRTDLTSGSFDDMKKSIKKLFDRFSNVIIYPGHDKSCNIDTAKKRINLLVAIKEGENN